MTAHRVTCFDRPPDRPVDGTTIYARPDRVDALIDQLMCRDCGTSLVADVADVADVKGHAQEAVVTYQRCPCLAASPAGTAERATPADARRDPHPQHTRKDPTMNNQFRGETLRVNPPRPGRFLRRTIPPAADYVPLAADGRAKHHVPGFAAPDTWPIRRTRCGDHPGVYGDNRQPVTVLRLAR